MARIVIVPSGKELPFGMKAAPDGSLVLVGDATVWNDQVSNAFDPDENIIHYSLANEVYEQEVPFGFYKGKIWVKTTIGAHQTKVFKFTPDDTKSPNNEMIFYLYDDFTETRNNIWGYKTSYLSNGELITPGGNQVFGAMTKFAIPANMIIEWNMYSKNHDFDAGIKVGNIYFISDRGTGNHYIGTTFSYPSGSQGANQWNDYQVILRDGYQSFKNETNGKIITASKSYTPGVLQVFDDSDTSNNPLRIGYLCIRKDYDTSVLIIQTTQTETGYEVTITNNGETTLENIEVALDDIPLNNYYVTEQTVSPIVETVAFPQSIDSSLRFFTQFNHSAKINSVCNFHIHVYIPPSAPEGYVLLKVQWVAHPPVIVSGGEDYREVGHFSSTISEVTKKFKIYESFRGKHVILNFGGLDTVKYLSQVVFHKVTRLGSDSQDTWDSPLPVLYMDWHTENDTFGSQDEFVKVIY